MKLKLLALFLSLSCLSTMADDVKSQFVIWAKNGTHVCYALNEKPKVLFRGSDLLVVSKGIEVSYPLSDMLRFTVEDETITSITDLLSEKIHPKIEGEYLIFPNTTVNSNVSHRGQDTL